MLGVLNGQESLKLNLPIVDEHVILFQEHFPCGFSEGNLILTAFCSDTLGVVYTSTLKSIFLLKTYLVNFCKEHQS